MDTRRHIITCNWWPWHEHYVPGYGHMSLTLPWVLISTHTYLTPTAAQAPATACSKAPHIHCLVRCKIVVVPYFLIDKYSSSQQPVQEMWCPYRNNTTTFTMFDSSPQSIANTNLECHSDQLSLDSRHHKLASQNPSEDGWLHTLHPDEVIYNTSFQCPSYLFHQNVTAQALSFWH